MAEFERSPQARARAERALLWLLHELREERGLFLVVLGGLVPETLTRDAAGAIPQHLGTADIDVLLIAHVDPEVNLGAVERALGRLDFSPDKEKDGWRWRGKVEEFPVLVEFLCDLGNYREGESIRPNGCNRLAAANLRGTGYVAHDFEWEEISGVAADGTETTVRVRFAGLQGYLLSKCVAVRTRAAAKDYYDFAYVLLHNRAGGPEDAAMLLLSGAHADAIDPLDSTFREVRERYRRAADDGPRFYAEQALLAEPEADEALLRSDAVDAVRRFFEKLIPG